MKDGRKMSYRLVCVGLAVLACILLPACATVEQEGLHRPNVLFIAVDDLNDWVGYLGGHEQSQTPHIGRRYRSAALMSWSRVSRSS